MTNLHNQIVSVNCLCWLMHWSWFEQLINVNLRMVIRIVKVCGDMTDERVRIKSLRVTISWMNYMCVNSKQIKSHKKIKIKNKKNNK